MGQTYLAFAAARVWRYQVMFHRAGTACRSCGVNPFVRRAASWLEASPWPYRDEEAFAAACRLWFALDGFAAALSRDAEDTAGRPSYVSDPDFVDRFARMLLRALAAPAQVGAAAAETQSMRAAIP